MNNDIQSDDIPVAQRESQSHATGAANATGAAIAWKAPRRTSRFALWMVVGGLLALLLGGLMTMLLPRLNGGGAIIDSATSPSAAATTSSATEADAPTLPDDVLLGHFPYDEAPASTLEPLTADGSIRLREAAAERMAELLAAARRNDIQLELLSGFRSIEDQNTIFFDRKAERGQRAVERASVSAPPGYSEHHTGYAIDVGDAGEPDTHLTEEFEETEAFEWMEENAARFGFELSFPRNNPQGVSYEPWHWRFVGDRHSLETFYKSRNVRPELPARPLVPPSERP
ncbi:MAG: M15 family metallopeptidase [Cyanobacteria bacterium J06638_22]